MNKPIALIHFGRAITSVAGVTLCKQAKHFVEQLRTTHDFILVVGRVKSAKFSRKKVEAILNVKFLDVITCQQKWTAGLMTVKYNDWFEFLRDEDWFSRIDNIDKIFIFGGLLSSGAGICRVKRKTNEIVTKKSFMSFDAIANYLSVTLQLITTANKHKAELFEICYDPEEFSIDLFTDERLKMSKYTLLFPYSIPAYNMVRYDYAQHDLQFNSAKEKNLEFVFGASFVTPSRYAIWDDVRAVIDIIDETNSELLITHNKLRLSNSVSYDAYLAKLAHAKFTLVIPAYDVSTFSCIRFMEAISLGCLPLILHTVNYSDFVKCFSIDQNKFAELIVTSENISDLLGMPEATRNSALVYFRKLLSL